MSAWLEMATGGHYNAASNQAWRDNFNDGWAAGDWTGNHNAQIAADRWEAGERTSEVAANLPDGYRVDPSPAPVNPNSGGGSVGQGVSPSQSGKPGAGGPIVPTDPEVVKASPKFKPSGFGGGLISGGGYWIDKIKSDLGAVTAGGKNKHSMASKPLEHEQAIIGGNNIVHDPGFSPVEVMETIYGEGDGIIPGPTSIYQWVKFGADLNKTLEANGYPRLDQVGDWITHGPNAIGREINRAGVDWLQQNVPMVESDPLPPNPYGGSSPWSQPFQ